MQGELHQLIVEACKRKSWRATDLHAAILAGGVKISLQAVCGWLKGGGVAEKHRAVLAQVLEVDVDVVLRAAAGLRAA